MDLEPTPSTSCQPSVDIDSNELIIKTETELDHCDEDVAQEEDNAESDDAGQEFETIDNFKDMDNESMSDSDSDSDEDYEFVDNMLEENVDMESLKQPRKRKHDEADKDDCMPHEERKRIVLISK